MEGNVKIPLRDYENDDDDDDLINQIIFLTL
jgi:hypothetical protein